MEKVWNWIIFRQKVWKISSFPEKICSIRHTEICLQEKQKMQEMRSENCSFQGPKQALNPGLMWYLPLELDSFLLGYLQEPPF